MKIREDNVPVADNILYYISKNGLKQRAVARRAGYTTQAMNGMLNGRRVIRPTDIQRLAAVLKVTPNDLFRTRDPDKAS